MPNMKNIISLLALSALSVPAIWAGSTQGAGQETAKEFEFVVPEGTVIPIVLTAYLNSRNSQVGDTVYADTSYPIWIQQRLVIPEGSKIRGTVTRVVRPGKVKGRGQIAVRFDDIMLPNGVKRDFIASFRGIHGPGNENLDRKSETVTAGTSKGAGTGTVVGTTGTGAIVGAIAADGSGAAIGAGIGAAAGIATVLFTRDRDLVLSPGTQFDLELKRPIMFAYNEIEFSNAELNSSQRGVRSTPARNPSANPDNNKRRYIPIPGIGIPGLPAF
jgi:hypothetical protein